MHYMNKDWKIYTLSKNKFSPQKKSTQRKKTIYTKKSKDKHKTKLLVEPQTEVKQNIA